MPHARECRAGFYRLAHVTALVACAVSTLSAAQKDTPAGGPPITDPVAIEFTHVGGISGFALYVTSEGGLSSRVDLGLLRANDRGVFRAALPVFPPGTYTLALVAYGSRSLESERAVASQRIVVTGRKGPAAAAPSSEPPAVQAIETRETAQRSRKNLGKRLWEILVGSDEEP